MVDDPHGRCDQTRHVAVKRVPAEKAPSPTPVGNVTLLKHGLYTVSHTNLINCAAQLSLIQTCPQLTACFVAAEATCTRLHTTPALYSLVPQNASGSFSSMALDRILLLRNPGHQCASID